MLSANHNLKFRRIKAGLTQFELAKRLGVNERVISFWETGRSEPHIEQAVDIARVLETEPKDIFPDIFANI